MGESIVVEEEVFKEEIVEEEVVEVEKVVVVFWFERLQIPFLVDVVDGVVVVVENGLEKEVELEVLVETVDFLVVFGIEVDAVGFGIGIWISERVNSFLIAVRRGNLWPWQRPWKSSVSSDQTMPPASPKLLIKRALSVILSMSSYPTHWRFL